MINRLYRHWDDGEGRRYSELVGAFPSLTVATLVRELIKGARVYPGSGFTIERVKEEDAE